jgi:hypothetical protein
MYPPHITRTWCSKKRGCSQSSPLTTHKELISCAPISMYSSLVSMYTSLVQTNTLTTHKELISCAPISMYSSLVSMYTSLVQTNTLTTHKELISCAPGVCMFVCVCCVLIYI